MPLHKSVLLPMSNYSLGEVQQSQILFKVRLGGLAQWLALQTTDHGVPGSRPGQGAVCCGLEQVLSTG